MATEGHRFEDMIELQTTIRALEVEVMGRYVAHPGALNKIRLMLAQAFDGLADLREQTLALGPPGECPDGWLHRATCACIPFAAATDADLEAERTRAIEDRREE